jgi:hypothetical protein
MLPILTAAMQLAGDKQKAEAAKKQKRIDAASGNLGGGAQPQAQGNGLQNALGMLGQFKGGGDAIQADGLSSNTKGVLDGQFGQPGSVSDDDLLDAY